MNWILCQARAAGVKVLGGLTATFFGLLVALPQAAATLSAVFLGATILLVASRIFCALRSQPVPLERRDSCEDFVSIHIATYSEPPEVVCRTLDSLARLNYDNYEVIVLDNNTPEAALYEPVREHCRTLGERFRFYHFDGVRGAKAGALNISLRLADPATEYILILDADYQAEPDILSSGLAYFSHSDVGLVQFPQAYRNSSDSCGLSWEYRLFFDVYMNLANSHNTVLSTGTAAFVNRSALEKSGGWSGDTLTEDAELGLRLHRYGYRGVYVPQVAAAGVMPTDLESLRVQRRRWVLGNAQSLSALWKEADLPWGRKAMMVLQLTAWASPLSLPTVAMLVAGLFYEFSGDPLALQVFAMSCASVATYLLGMMMFFLVATARHGGSLAAGYSAYLAHLGLLWEASICPWELFVSSDKSFERTCKFLKAPRLAAFTLSLLLGVVGVATGFNLMVGGGSLTLAAGCLVLSTGVLGQAFLRWNLHQIRNRTS